MNKKKAIKIVAASAIAASAFAAVAPTQSQAATSVATTVTNAQKAMKAPFDKYYQTGITKKTVSAATVQALITKGEKAYADATAVVKKSGGKSATTYKAKLDGYKKYLDRSKAYVAGLGSISKVYANADAALKANTVAALEKSQAELKDAKNQGYTGISKIYGPVVREVLTGTFKRLSQGKLDKIEAALEELATPAVTSVSAINDTQAVVTFKGDVGEVSAANFTADNGLTVVKAEVNPENKKQVTLTFNKSLADKTDYAVTVNGVKSASGVEMKEAQTSTFSYEIGEVSKVELTKSTFVNGDDIADSVKLTNAKGIDVTNEYSVTVSSTSAKVAAPTGTVTGATEKEVAYVQVTVKDAGGNTVTQSDALKVTLAPSAVSSVANFGLGNDVDTVTDFKTALKDGDLVSEMKLSDAPNLELLVNNNGSEEVVDAADITKIENLTPAVATASVNGAGELVVNAFSTGTAQVKLTIGDFVTTVSFTVKADSKITSATLDKSSVAFNTANVNTAETSNVNVKLADQYNKDFNATIVGSTGKVSVGGSEVGTMTVKSSNTNVATAALSDVTTAASSLPVTVTEVGKGTATITAELKDTKGNVVFTKTFTVTGKDAGAFAGYSIETDATAIDLDQDTPPEVNDDAVNFTVYEVDAQGNKIQAVNPANVTLSIQGYDKDPEVKSYVDVDAVNDAVVVKGATAYKTFAGSGTLNVDVLVNGTKIGTKAVKYTNTDAVATKAVVNTTDIVIDNDKVSGTDAALDLSELFSGHYDAVNSKYTLAPKLSIQDQSGKVIDWDTANAGTLANTDALALNGVTFTTTNVTNVDIVGGMASLSPGKTSGSFTVVVSDVDTNQVTDILSAPVAFKVTIVD